MRKLLIKLNSISNFNQRKTVTFGDSSLVSAPGGRFWTFLSVFTLVVLWILSGVLEWVEPVFWPPIENVWGQFVSIFSLKPLCPKARML